MKKSMNAFIDWDRGLTLQTLIEQPVSDSEDAKEGRRSFMGEEEAGVQGAVGVPTPLILRLSSARAAPPPMGITLTLLSEPTALALSRLGVRERRTCSICDPPKADLRPI